MFVRNGWMWVNVCKKWLEMVGCGLMFVRNGWMWVNVCKKWLDVG